MSPTAAANALKRLVRSTTSLLVGALLNFASVAVPAAASAPPDATAGTQPADAFDDAGCTRTLSTGGAAPPTVAGAALRAKVKDILNPYRGSPLTPASAAEVRAAFCKAGIWSHPGLDQALAAWGLSAKQLDALAPVTPARAARPAPPASGAGRKIPPRE